MASFSPNLLTFLLQFVVCALLPATIHADIISLTSDEFYTMATTGQVDLMIDVRTQEEWDTGHIENATFIDSLQTILRNTPLDAMDETLADLGLLGCQNCRTVVYCRSGSRASVALELLQTKAGFQGPLYNGQGASQWRNAGYDLIKTPSATGECMKALEDPFCPRSSAGDGTIADTPTSAPSLSETTLAPDQPVIKKEAPAEAKCGSIANQLGVGGAAAQAKDCSRNGNGRQRRMRLRGL